MNKKRGVPTRCAPCHAGDRHVGRDDIEPDPEVLPFGRGGDGVARPQPKASTSVLSRRRDALAATGLDVQIYTIGS